MLPFCLHVHILPLCFLSESLKVSFSHLEKGKTQSDIMQRERKEQDIVVGFNVIRWPMPVVCPLAGFFPPMCWEKMVVL